MPDHRGRMQQPALANDGYTYERMAIKLWVFQNQTSPMTRQPVTSITLDHALKTLIGRNGRSRTQPIASIPWQLQVDMWCSLFENVLNAIELVVDERDAGGLAVILTSLQTPMVPGLPDDYDPVMPLPGKSNFALPAMFK